MRSLKSFSSRSSTGGWGFDVEECEEQNSAQSCGRAGWPSANRAARQPAQLRAPNNLSSPPAYNWQHIFRQIFLSSDRSFRGRRLLLEHALAQIDAVFQISLERAQHLRPPLAVPVGRLETSFGLAPALFRDQDQGPAVFKRLKRHGHGGLVASRCCHGCVAVRRCAVVCLPSEHDPALRFDLHDPDRERSWKIVEVPRDGCSRLKASLGSARREIARQLCGVDDGLKDLRDGFGDPRCYLERQVHRLPPCLPGPSRSAQLNSEPTGEGRAVQGGPKQFGPRNRSEPVRCHELSADLTAV